MRQAADLAYYFNMDACEHSEKFVLLMLCQIPYIQAREEIRTRNIQSELTPERLRKLVVTAGGSTEEADKAVAWLRLNRNLQKILHQSTGKKTL